MYITITGNTFLGDIYDLYFEICGKDSRLYKKPKRLTETIDNSAKYKMKKIKHKN